MLLEEVEAERTSEQNLAMVLLGQRGVIPRFDKLVPQTNELDGLDARGLQELLDH